MITIESLEQKAKEDKEKCVELRIEGWLLSIYWLNGAFKYFYANKPIDREYARHVLRLYIQNVKE